MAGRGEPGRPGEPHPAESTVLGVPSTAGAAMQFAMPQLHPIPGMPGYVQTATGQIFIMSQVSFGSGGHPQDAGSAGKPGDERRMADGAGAAAAAGGPAAPPVTSPSFMFAPVGGPMYQPPGAHFPASAAAAAASFDHPPGQYYSFAPSGYAPMLPVPAAGHVPLAAPPHTSSAGGGRGRGAAGSAAKRPRISSGEHDDLPGATFRPLSGSRGGAAAAVAPSGRVAVHPFPRAVCGAAVASSAESVDWSAARAVNVPEGTAAHLAEYVQSIHGTTSPLDHVVRIWTPRVVQKSYGSEKRFFCPPPYAEVLLPSAEAHVPPLIRIGLEDAGGKYDAQVTVEPAGAGGHIAKARFMYISNTDKRKQFNVRVNVQQGDGRDVGVFQSAPLRVISKPSKRKFSLSNMDMRIDSGESVALFNRVRSQSGSTRFLRSAGSAFEASMSKWGTFDIRSSKESGLPPHSDFIHYNMDVVLKSRETGLLSAPYVIRKVERNAVAAADNDPVSQLQKIAFLIKGEAQGLYLASNESEITVCQAKIGPDGTETLPDNCIWTISSAEVAEHILCTKWAVPALSATFAGIVDQPLVSSIKDVPGAIEVYGSGFHPHLAVWFEGVPALTVHRGSGLMICKTPPITVFADADGKVRSRPLSVHLLLVRTDGTIYRTNYGYTFPDSDHAALEGAQAQQHSKSGPVPTPAAAPAAAPAEAAVAAPAAESAEPAHSVAAAAEDVPAAAAADEHSGAGGGGGAAAAVGAASRSVGVTLAPPNMPRLMQPSTSNVVHSDV